MTSLSVESRPIPTSTPRRIAIGIVISSMRGRQKNRMVATERIDRSFLMASSASSNRMRSEEHTSELQSQSNLVCRLLLEKKKKKQNNCNSELTNIYKT